MITYQDKITILLTFITGIFIGGYLYLTGFATTFLPPEAGESNVYTEFVITAESYGSCALDKTCLSFQVLESGVYRAIRDTVDGQVSKDARIPFGLKKELYTVLVPTELTLLSKKLSVPGCQYEGTNYRFKVTRDQIEYVIDTCQTAISYESSEWKVLAKLWNYMGSLNW